MTETIFKILTTAIGRETVDKFIEDENGNLKGVETVSLYALAEAIAQKCIRRTAKSRIRKKAVKEVLQKVRSHIPPRESNRATLDDCYMLDRLNDIAEEYGVEVDG